MRLRWYPPAALGREGQSVVGALQVAEPLAATHVAPLEAQLGEAEAADAGRGRALTRRGGDEDEPAGGGGGGHGEHDRPSRAHVTWTVDPIFTSRGSTAG